MSRKSLALFLATTGLVTTLAGCGGAPEAKDHGGDDRPSSPSTSPANGSPEESNDQKDKPAVKGDADDKHDEGGEGGEGGEG